MSDWQHGRWPDDKDPSATPGRGPGFKITRCWIVVSTDPKGAEGACGMVDPLSGIPIPALATDKRRRDLLKYLAQNLATMSGRPTKLVAFSVREDEEEFKP